MCPQQYLIEYVLGRRSPSNKKADKGTIVHKVLEILAIFKYNKQNNIDIFEDEILGEVSTKKSEYMDAVYVGELTKQIYDYYTSSFDHHEWSEKDFKDCIKWVNKAIEHNDGMFDPRYKDIIKPEQHFDITIDRPWSAYEYDHKGQKIKGNLGIKGTIDLITKVDDDTIEIIDWKTGRRLDWATGEEKTFAKLRKDFQLRLYHYAISHLYPDYSNIIVSINFINDGGPFSLMFHKEDLNETEDMIRNKFETIKRTRKPKLNKSWKCKKLCHFGKSTFEDSETIDSIIEYRDGQTTPKGQFMTACEQIKHDTDMHDLNYVVDKYTEKDYNVAAYKAPGSTE